MSDKNTRVRNSVVNSITSIVSNILIIVMGFVAQTIFIKVLGTEYLGINGLFTNIVSMLAIVELGIGPAIIYSLYKPLVEDDEVKIKSLLKFYKKCYSIIALAIFILGLCVLPFLKYFVKTSVISSKFGIYGIFFLFILDAVFSYICSYKRSILQADQKSHYINIIHSVMYLVMNGLQILFLLTTKNYVVYLIIKILSRFIENIIITNVVNKKYPYIKDKDAQDLSDEDKGSIFKRVKGLIFHKVGGYIVLGTDNILISKLVGIVQVGLYSNYYMIINSVATLISQIFTSITASVGNLLVKESEEKSYNIFKRIMFLNFWIYGFASTAMYVMMEPFITFWLGSEYLLPRAVLVILVINFYMTGMRASIGVYKEAAGIYYEDRFIPIIESTINIVVSIVLGKIYGLTGIFIGTMVSSFVVVFFSLPYFVYTKVFKKNITQYYKVYFKYAIITLISVALTSYLFNSVYISAGLNNKFVILLVAIIASIMIPNLMYIILFAKTEEFKYFVGLIKKFWLKITKREDVHEENNG